MSIENATRLQSLLDFITADSHHWANTTINWHAETFTSAPKSIVFAISNIYA